MCVKFYLLTLSLVVSLHAFSLKTAKRINLKQLSDLSHTADSIIRTTGSQCDIWNISGNIE
jgi:hypothetical protein